jgi:hypothetical protein
MTSRQVTLIVFGSVLTRGFNAHDIDMVVPEFTDRRMYDDDIDLALYEKIAHATNKPIDLFFTAAREAFNVAGYYDPTERRWLFRMAFCGKHFFDACREISYDKLIRMVQQPSRVYAGELLL